MIVTPLTPSPLSCCLSLSPQPTTLLSRDMLRFADADEAEAVYSMVSLTQAAHRQQGKWQQLTSQPADVRGPVIEVRPCTLLHTA